MVDHPARLAGAVAIALAFGCSGLFPPPEVTGLTIAADQCGTWTATINAHGRGDVLAVTADGRVVRTFPVDGNQTLTATGTATPGRATLIEAKIGASSMQQIETLPAIDATIVVSPPGGLFPPNSPAVVDVLLATPCKLGGPVVRAELRRADDPGGPVVWSAADVPIQPGVGAHIVVPGQARGLYVLAIDATSGDLPLGHESDQLYWGTAEDDLDRDGYTGGFDGSDCDDNNARVNPSVDEAPQPNQIDDNCDGRVDEGTIAYDDDGDGATEQQGDCDDADGTRYPGAIEVPDCRDQNCDGVVDEGVALIPQDDAYEPNDTSEHAHDLATSRVRSFDNTLTAVTRDVGDEEWFEFYSQDGDWDSWGIDATAVGVPQGGVYDVSIYGGSGYPLQTMRITGGTHAEIRVIGEPFRDDSGNYQLRIKPISITTPWCPVMIRLQSF